VVEETLSLLQSTIPSTVELICDIPLEKQFLTIDANPSQIQEALLNLCSNAVDAMNEKGTLTLSLNRVELLPKDIPNQNDSLPGPYVSLLIGDTGCGMTEKTIEKIFDPFFSTKEVGKGTGLGLSSVQGIVEHHQGLLKVQSTPDHGTTITMYFPLRDQIQTESFDVPDNLPRGHEKILVVDDEEMLAQTVKMMLSDMGYQVKSLTSSTKALAAIQKNPEQFDLIITDQTMPELTGRDLAQTLKKIRPDLPIVLFTGNSSRLSAEEADMLGISAYLIKPVDLKKLLLTVRRLLDKKSN
jgi:CheY-like chemotaxis protein